MFYYKKIIIIIVIVIIAIAIGGFLFFLKNQTPKDLSKISDKEIIGLLEKNQDSKDYMEKNKDFKIEEKIILTKENILEGQNGQNFKEVYQGLELEDNRYLKINLINSAGNNGLVSVIDFKDGKVLKAYGLILLKSNVK